MGRERRESVRLREKAMKGGGSSLYLDIYVNGVRSYEFLKLYLVPEMSRADRERNRETMRVAERTRTRRQLEADEGRLELRTKADRVPFFDYFSECAARRQGSTAVTWSAVLTSLKDYERDHSLPLSSVSRAWVQGWVDYLDRATVHSASRHGAPLKPRKGRRGEEPVPKPLCNSTKLRYVAVLKAVLNTAVQDGLIPKTPAFRLAVPRDTVTERVFLTVEEVRMMAATECRCPELARAFLFSCLTGLRYSDVMRLRREDVSVTETGTRITFRQKKTGEMVYTDISPRAAALMPEDRDRDGRPFRLDCRESMVSRELRLWANRAGIAKPVHFHSARHTFAIMMLELDVDLYTVSKLLGHTDIKTTQIYARILDKRKRNAVGRIPDIF